MDTNKLGIKPHCPILDAPPGLAAIIVVFFHLAEPGDSMVAEIIDIATLIRRFKRVVFGDQRAMIT